MIRLLITGLIIAVMPACHYRAANAPSAGAKQSLSVTGDVRPIQVISRRFWLPAKPVLPALRLMEQARRITIHHDGRSNYARGWRAVARRIRELQEADLRAGRADIAWHFVVDREGRIWEGRPIQYEGEHTARHNEGNIGVLLLGDFERQTLNERQKSALVGLLGHLCTSYNIALSEVKTHRELTGVVCPGRYVQALVESLRRKGLTSGCTVPSLSNTP